MKKNRREFLTDSFLAGGALMTIGSFGSVFGETASDEIGKPLPPWSEGTIDLHFIYTGVGENMFYIFPDSTTMLLDAADRQSNQEDQFPIKPDKSRLPSEWIARYIERVSPTGKKIDYMLLSHFHSDHAGNPNLSAGQTSGRGDDYALCGLANLGEKFTFGKVFDRCGPNDDDLVAGSGSDALVNFRKFIRWKLKNKEFAMEPFRVGALDQLKLVHKPADYPDFHIRNITANGQVWTGEGENVVNMPALWPKNNFSENALSIAQLFSYGPFRYFAGGDLSGKIVDENGTDRQLEGLAGKAAGQVDVCKTNHHSYKDAMRQEFTREVKARVYVTNVWDDGHLQDNTMTAMTDPNVYSGERIVCPTWVSEKQKAKYPDKPWLKSLHPAYGHVVVRVVDGGKKYKVYHLTADDESMTVKAVFGPFDSVQKG